MAKTLIILETVPQNTFSPHKVSVAYLIRDNGNVRHGTKIIAAEANPLQTLTPLIETLWLEASVLAGGADVFESYQMRQLVTGLDRALIEFLKGIKGGTASLSDVLTATKTELAGYPDLVTLYNRLKLVYNAASAADKQETQVVLLLILVLRVIAARTSE